MTFNDLRARLVENLRLRVRSGVSTERGLSRQIGISQPHLHHVLKGTRRLALETADEVLRRLNLDIIDLIAPEDLRERRLHR